MAGPRKIDGGVDGGIPAESVDTADTTSSADESESLVESDLEEDVIIEDFADAVNYCYDPMVDVCEQAAKMFSVEAYLRGQPHQLESCSDIQDEFESPAAFGDIDETTDLLTCSMEEFTADGQDLGALTLRSLSTDRLLRALAPFITYQDVASED